MDRLAVMLCGVLLAVTVARVQSAAVQSCTKDSECTCDVGIAECHNGHCDCEGHHNDTQHSSLPPCTITTDCSTVTCEDANLSAHCHDDFCHCEPPEECTTDSDCKTCDDGQTATCEPVNNHMHCICPKH